MWKNYLNIALRNLWKYKQVTFINLFGLTIGITAFLLIFLFVQYELSFDAYHDKSDRIYRVSREWLNQDMESSLHLGHVAPPFGPLLENDFPGIVEEAVRFLEDNPIITYEEGDINIVEENFFFADEEAFSLFSWKLLEGEAEAVLSEPNSIVISETAAKRYFGNTDPIGKTLIYNGEAEFQVSGIMENVPANSHFHPELIASFKAVENFFGREQLMQQWGSNNYATYLLLPEGYSPENLEAQFPDFITKHLGTHNGIPAGVFNLLHLWPLTDIHLYSHLDSEIEANGDIKYVYIYSIIAIFILVIACINFINLATARSMRRAREVGVRKVMGALRIHLIRQFLTESVILSLVSLVVGLVLLSIFIPDFNNFVQRGITIDLSNNGVFIVVIILTITLVGIIAGSYPAFILSSFQPSTILRASQQPKGKHPYLRSALVIIQFTISIALIIGVITVEKQLAYVKSKPLNFNDNHVAVLPINDDIYRQYENIKDRLLQQSGITDVSMSSRVPSGRLLDSQGISAEVEGEMQEVNFRVADIHIDHDYLNTLQVNVLAGRNFDRDRVSDSTESFIINESAVTAMGWKSIDEAIGKNVDYGEGNRRGKVIGVVEDFHFESLHQPIAPIIFLITEGRANNIIVRIAEDQWDKSIAYLQEQWSYLMPAYPFDFYTIRSRFEEQYTAEDRLSKVVSYFSLLALFIAALGLVGLASYTAEQRFKEIGIRKVMGASAIQILLLLGRKFTFLVIVSFAVASPIAYWIMNRWLESFAYHDVLPWWSFLTAGVFALIIAWVTVGSQTYKAANSNPVKILREH
ncbi:putative ABC transport system permease protein [Catalinimonas alkaloidigena]|uniref:ABC transporter permease n=1 Tax=Catalinimonas alkaloidigena TaxID=1075417 RepID=UPI0024063247|nr:ABC transporter permease [Catalinimonas alkaloidigena]MDF9797427.1 putative ABC transport system permease protein [Catalinimonas alkaloidigena]